jgi:hypothetical protein
VINMIVTQPLVLNGTRYASGDRICADADKASDLLQARRAKLVDPADLALLIDAQDPRAHRRIVGRFTMSK